MKTLAWVHHFHPLHRKFKNSFSIAVLFALILFFEQRADASFLISPVKIQFHSFSPRPSLCPHTEDRGLLSGDYIQKAIPSETYRNSAVKKGSLYFIHRFSISQESSSSVVPIQASNESGLINLYQKNSPIKYFQFQTELFPYHNRNEVIHYAMEVCLMSYMSRRFNQTNYFKRTSELETQRAPRLYRLKKRIETVLSKISRLGERDYLSPTARVLRAEIMRFLESPHLYQDLGDQSILLLRSVSDELAQVSVNPLVSLKSNLLMLLNEIKKDSVPTVKMVYERLDDGWIQPASRLKTRMNGINLVPFVKPRVKKWERMS